MGCRYQCLLVLVETATHGLIAEESHGGGGQCKNAQGCDNLDLDYLCLSVLCLSFIALAVLVW